MSEAGAEFAKGGELVALTQAYLLGQVRRLELAVAAHHGDEPVHLAHVEGHQRGEDRAHQPDVHHEERGDEPFRQVVRVRPVAAIFQISDGRHKCCGQCHN